MPPGPLVNSVLPLGPVSHAAELGTVATLSAAARVPRLNAPHGYRAGGAGGFETPPPHSSWQGLAPRVTCRCSTALTVTRALAGHPERRSNCSPSRANAAGPGRGTEGGIYDLRERFSLGKAPRADR